MQKGQIGINGVHRRWASFSVGQEVTVEPYDIHSEGMDIYLGNLKLDIDFFQRSSRYPDEFKEEELDKAFSVVKKKSRHHDIHISKHDYILELS